MNRIFEIGEITMNQRRKIYREFAKRYRKAKSKKEKSKILDEFVILTHLNRSYAANILRHDGTCIYYKKARFKADIGKSNIHNRGRKKIYDGKELTEALEKIWQLTMYMCGSRLKAAMPNILHNLEKHRDKYKDYQFSDEVKEKLLSMSAATIDRILKPKKDKLKIKGNSHTKPGSLLKSQIPIRTFSNWDENKPGFVETDLVGHDGGNLRGEFCYTLNMTDIYTGWTEMFAVKNKARIWVINGIDRLSNRLPFRLKGIDSDNGSEFINDHLLYYCREREITFTRGRPYRKNDNCYVEQKNWSVIRNIVGYARHDTPEELNILNELYENLRLLVNYFQPSAKLISKEWNGTKYRKIYDTPKTPFQRVEEYYNSHPEEMTDEIKNRLIAARNEYENIDLIEIKNNIKKYIIKLKRINKKKNTITNENLNAENIY